MSTLKIGDKTVKTITIESKDVKSISIDGITVWEKETPVTWDYFYIENCDSVAGTITFEDMSGKNIEYSNDAVNWTTLSIPSASAVTIDSVAPNQKVYLRGTNSAVGTSTSGKHISADFNHNLGGNICSLLDKTNFSTMTSISANSALRYLFYQDTKLISAAFNFGNVISLGDRALSSAFNGCASLTAAPDMSSVTSLVDDALSYAFQGCTSLTAAPDLSSVTTVGTGALYSAFNGCSKLQTIYVPDIDTWDNSKFSFSDWVLNAGYSATNPQMIFQTQELLDACPSGNSGYGNYTKVLAQ